MRWIAFFGILRILPLFASAIDHATIGIYAVDSRDGKVVAEKNIVTSLVPASCMKIVTTAAALHILGADSRFATSLEYDGLIDSDHVLHGNLYIRGGGDPCLGSDRMAGSLSWQRQMEVWVEAVQGLGIQRIVGKVIGDASLWETALAVPSWSWEDLGNYYGAGASALSFHENEYRLVFKPGKTVGDPACILQVIPPVPRLVLQNNVTTGAAGSGDQACIYGSEVSWAQWVRGTIPAAVSEFAIRGAIADPALYVADLLQTTLEEKGVAVDLQQVASRGKRTAFHTTYSPSVKEIVRWTNQKSINLYAEHLLKKMGEVVYQEGSTAAGIKAVTNFWSRQKVDLEGFSMADGSGLSRKNLITVKQLVQMLLKIEKSPFYEILRDSFPQVQDSIRAKSGSMSLVKGYAGYAGPIAFAIFVNQCADHLEIKKTIDSLFAKITEQ
jgi:D-alanyl-D-alanine carboxypeptidase/D-alanyl-D-alanine-endopeptidase (penicillin-binding protein 4)